MNKIFSRVDQFCRQYQLDLPILLGPMAGACPPSLSAAIANAGGLGSCGALLMSPDEIITWVKDFRTLSEGVFQLNIWIPDPAPVRNAKHEANIRSFLGGWGPNVPAEAADVGLHDFNAQCEAFLASKPPIVSSVMGLYPPAFVDRLKEQGIRWFANISTVAEARAAEAAGADVVVAQGMEAGGHRGCFDGSLAEAQQVGLFSLLPAVVDAVRIPVVATGGIADARGIAAALMLGASAVQIGTGYLRTPEAKLATAWADALARTAPEDTTLTRAFSGRAGRTIATDYVLAANSPEAPIPAPYPIQRSLTAKMRAEGTRSNDIRRIQAWSGQSAALAQASPAGELTRALWRGTQDLLGDFSITHG